MVSITYSTKYPLLKKQNIMLFSVRVGFRFSSGAQLHVGEASQSR